MVYNIIMMVVLNILMSQIMNRAWNSDMGHHFYLWPADKEPVAVGKEAVDAIFKYYLLLNGVIPLNLAVIVRLGLMFYVGFVTADAQMISGEKSLQSGELKGCKVKNLELMQDFSLINNIFCDKTGTLTKNQLIFKTLVVNGHTFSVDEGMEKFTSSIKSHALELAERGQVHEQFLNMWRCICVCHDVIQVKFNTTKNALKPEAFQGASQDEVTFIEMAKEVGFTQFVSRNSDTITIKVQEKTETYKILRMIDFSSDRKRMSVIVRREEDGKVFNFIKGADLTILPRLTEESKSSSKETIELMDKFAAVGLRTLMFAMKELPSSAVDNVKEEPESTFEDGI
jgi:magnesium-transporting ATPase (P-type)